MHGSNPSAQQRAGTTPKDNHGDACSTPQLNIEITSDQPSDNSGDEMTLTYEELQALEAIWQNQLKQ